MPDHGSLDGGAPYREPAPDRDGPLKEALTRVWRPNMGYRMAHALVKDEFAPLNLKRVHRVWKESRLGRARRYRKKRTGSGVPLSAQAPNHVWCVDFVHDSCLNGTKLKVLSVVDEFTRECLALEVDTRQNASRVQDALEPLIEFPRRSGLRSQRQWERVRRQALGGVPCRIRLGQPLHR